LTAAQAKAPAASGADIEISFEELSGQMPRCPFLEDMREGDDRRRLTLVALLFACGQRDSARFAAAIGELPTRRAAEIAPRLRGIAPRAAVSRFVSAAAAAGILRDVLDAISRAGEWQRRHYLAGSVVRYPWVVAEARGMVSQLTAEENEGLLDSLNYDDERRYIEHLPFEFLLVGDEKKQVELPEIIRQLENGLRYEGLSLTKGPWALIGAVARSGTASAEFVRVFEEVDATRVIDPGRKFASKMEEFLQRGIEAKLIARWVAEMASYRELVEPLYEADATIRDDVRARFLVAALRR
jgi:hypothetical protein